MTKVAAIQMASGPTVHANLLEAERLIGEAAGAGAELVALPENFAIMGKTEADKVAAMEAEGDGPLQAFLARQASRHGLWIVGGTIPLGGSDPARVRAACLVYDDRGRRAARFDKLHLFDVQVVGSTESYHESATIEPGDRACVVDTPFGRLGLAVCYDLRFPELFRSMLDQGMEVVVIPSAFTATTGRAHWAPLLRARAIENLCYVVAPAQGGFHANGRETYGHTMVVDPWGNVVAERERGTGVVVAEIDHVQLESTRRLFPTVSHRRLHCSMN